MESARFSLSFRQITVFSSLAKKFSFDQRLRVFNLQSSNATRTHRFAQELVFHRFRWKKIFAPKSRRKIKIKKFHCRSREEKEKKSAIFASFPCFFGHRSQFRSNPRRNQIEVNYWILIHLEKIFVGQNIFGNFPTVTHNRRRRPFMDRKLGRENYFPPPQPASTR